METPGSRKLVFFHCCRQLVLLGATVHPPKYPISTWSNSFSCSVRSSRWDLAFFCFFSLCDAAHPSCCCVAEALAALSVFGSSAAAKAESDVARVAIVSMRTSAVFMRVSPFFFFAFMKASRDGLALYTMQNRKGERLFRCEAEEYFLQKRE